MKLYLIEGYGGTHGINGKIHHFTVRADELEDAVALLRASEEGAHYRHFDLIEESVDFPADEPAIIEEGEGSFLETNH